MEEILAFIIAIWFIVASVMAIDNALFQTPDKRIIAQCKEQGYVAVKQTIVKCSIEKEVK
jgi:hypothetical protein